MNTLDDIGLLKSCSGAQIKSKFSFKNEGFKIAIDLTLSPYLFLSATIFR